MEVTVNGERHAATEGTTVAQLLEQLRLPPKFLAVERNLELVPREQHARCVLRDGDRLEIVTLVGGG